MLHSGARSGGVIGPPSSGVETGPASGVDDASGVGSGIGSWVASTAQPPSIAIRIERAKRFISSSPWEEGKRKDHRDPPGHAPATTNLHRNPRADGSHVDSRRIALDRL